MHSFKSNRAEIEKSNHNYLASVSDMMAGLLFIFIILLMVFVIKLQMQKEHYIEKTTELTDAKEVRAALLRDLERSLKQKGVRLTIDEEKGILRMPEDVLFPSGTAQLDLNGLESVKKLSESLFEELPCYAWAQDNGRPAGCEESEWKPGKIDAVFIEGHTDNMPLKKNVIFKDNWELSVKRSIVTYQTLIGLKPELEGLVNQNGEPLFSVSGYADARPLIKHANPTAEPSNRRIDLRFILAPPQPDSKTSKGAVP